MALKALIVFGGWNGHEPDKTAEIMATQLRGKGIEVDLSEDLNSFVDSEKLVAEYDLLTPHWTMGDMENEQQKGICDAVENGCSIGGIHGGMGDSFRKACQYQFMVGGQFVSHPGGGKTVYDVNFTDEKSPITEGMATFSVTSEQYYMHVDPGNRVLATTQFGNMTMPVAWTRKWGKGNVFYCSLGHNAEHLSQPEALELVTRGLVWAAEQAADAKKE